MKKIRQLILSTAIVATTFTNVIQPTQAQTGNFSAAGRWQCQNAIKGLTKKTYMAAALQEMIIDARPDGTFQAQVFQKSSYGNERIVGEGSWQIQQNSVVFSGQGKSSNPNTYGMSVPIVAMGIFQDANNFSTQMNDGQFATSYACRKL